MIPWFRRGSVPRTYTLCRLTPAAHWRRIRLLWWAPGMVLTLWPGAPTRPYGRHITRRQRADYRYAQRIADRRPHHWVLPRRRVAGRRAW